MFLTRTIKMSSEAPTPPKSVPDARRSKARQLGQYVSLHKAVDALRGYVRDAELFKDQWALVCIKLRRAVSQLA